MFRVDHFLAMTTVRNLLGTRLANRVLEPIWNSAHIAEVEIVWDESLALEGRAGYYDGVGALKDMLQTHLLQLLCLVAMEPPVSLGQRDLRDRKMEVLRSVRPLTDADVTRRTRRARYLAGRIDQDRTILSEGEAIGAQREDHADLKVDAFFACQRSRAVEQLRLVFLEHERRRLRPDDDLRARLRLLARAIHERQVDLHEWNVGFVGRLTEFAAPPLAADSPHDHGSAHA